MKVQVHPWESLALMNLHVRFSDIITFCKYEVGKQHVKESFDLDDRKAHSYARLSIDYVLANFSTGDLKN